MSSDPQVQVLLAGPIRGQFEKFIGRLEAIFNQKGVFEAVLTCSPLFGDDDTQFDKVKSGEWKLPMPVYALGPPDINCLKKYGDSVSDGIGGEICHNLKYFGKYGIHKFPSGFTVAYISPHLLPDGSYTIQNKDYIDLTSCIEKSPHFRGVDVFMSPLWPQSITTYAAVPVGYEDVQIKSSVHISHLARLLKPRYHLADSALPEGVIYERPPYRNHILNVDKPVQPTRFVSLACIDHPDCKKWLFGMRTLTLEQIKPDSFQDNPSLSTESPYVALPMSSTSAASRAVIKRKHIAPEIGVCSGQQPNGGSAEVDCWFCIGNNTCEQHLIAHVGEHNYIVLAKGGLVPHHILIVPIEHYGCSVHLTKEILEEMELYKRIIHTMFQNEGCSVIFYERNYCSRHMQVQAVPVPMSSPETLVGIFKRMGSQRGINFRVLPPNDKRALSEMVTLTDLYFYVELEDGHRLIYLINDRFPLFFGREIICVNILHLPTFRTDWKMCTLTKQDEVMVVKDIKKKFETCKEALKTE